MPNAVKLCGTILLLAGLIGAGPGPALGQEQEPEEIQAQNLMRYGMDLPRPVDSAARKRRGYAEPRPSKVILAEIDQLQSEMRAITRTDEVWKQRFREHYQLQRKRIELVSELEESGYQGSRLLELLTTKVEDINKVWNRNQGGVASYAALCREVATRHPGSDAARIAEWYMMLERIHFITHNGMHVAERDYSQIAEIDVNMPDPDKAGILLLEALRLSGDDALKAKWYDWMVNQLGPETAGYRVVMRKRMFGSPIRLRGDALRGGTVDTEDWQGDVILVDFWGMWCGPCKAAMPHLKELADEYGERGLRIVGVFVDHEFDKARDYLKTNQFDWPQIIWSKSNPDNFYEHPIVKKYAVGGYPTLWLIDRSGIVHNADRDELEQTVLEFLDKDRAKTRSPDTDR